MPSEANIFKGCNSPLDPPASWATTRTFNIEVSKSHHVERQLDVVIEKVPTEERILKVQVSPAAWEPKIVHMQVSTAAPRLVPMPASTVPKAATPISSVVQRPNDGKHFGECECPKEPFLTIPPAAKLIGFSTSTIRRAIKRGEIPVYHFGGLDRIRVSEVIKAIEASAKNGGVK